jgi:predicted  nucleic acid-binding Zn-ribbon protein
LSKAIGDLAALQGDVENYEQSVIPSLERNLELSRRRRVKVEERLAELGEATEVAFDDIDSPDTIISSTIQNLESEISNCDAKVLSAKRRIQTVRAESRRMEDLARAEKRSSAEALWAEELKIEKRVTAGDELAMRSFKLDRSSTDPFFRATIPRRHSTFEVAPSLKPA